MEERTLQGALTFLGFAMSIIAVFYFAVQYIPRVSPWTQVAALVLLGLCFTFLGIALRSTPVAAPFFGDRMPWLRPVYVLYMLAVFCGIVAEIRFLTIGDVPTPAKILVGLAIGVGLIFWAARRQRPASP